MKSNTQQIIIHIAGCIIFLALPILFSQSPSLSLRDFTGYLLLIIFFYVNFFVSIPRFYFIKKYIQFFLLTTACFLIILFIPNLGTEGPDFLFDIGQRLLLFLVVFFFSL